MEVSKREIEVDMQYLGEACTVEDCNLLEKEILVMDNTSHSKYEIAKYSLFHQVLYKTMIHKSNLKPTSATRPQYSSTRQWRICHGCPTNLNAVQNTILVKTSTSSVIISTFNASFTLLWPLLVLLLMVLCTFTALFF